MCRFNEYAGFTWFSCHAGLVRLLLDGCYGRWFVYVKQRNATASCWALRAGGMCTLLRTSFVDTNTGWQSIRSGKYPWCSDLSLCGKNMHSMKARFVLLICKLSPGVFTLSHFLPKVSVMGPMGFTHIGDWVGRGMSDDFREEFGRGNPELPLVTREVYVLKYFRSLWRRFETKLCPV